ncbi:hypothetical protein HPB50_010430 [Hyalomma asiaticum]|uniref:Uncharacterized protein n=1 Tax=Hyalomma asiaticum TaxID=266040 RepID=A0ACB7RN04_HYAAI|nr:hypothetical protein HPB50_010430 [Hyalomma asiaticum]
MDKAAERRARRAAAARARRSDPAVRAREAEASRDSARRRREEPAVRAITLLTSFIESGFSTSLRGANAKPSAEQASGSGEVRVPATMASSSSQRGYEPEEIAWSTISHSVNQSSAPSEVIRNENLFRLVERRSQRRKANMLPAAAKDAHVERLSKQQTPSTRKENGHVKPAWKPKPLQKVHPDDFVVVLKHRTTMALGATFEPGELGLSLRAYLGAQLAADLSFVLSREHDLMVACTSSRNRHEIGERGCAPHGHLKESGEEVCHGVVTIANHKTSETLKDSIQWRQGTIPYIRMFGMSNKARLTFAEKVKPRTVRYNSEIMTVRPYFRTIPACGVCCTVGHRAHTCPNPSQDRCGRCGQQAPFGEALQATHECNVKSALCGGGHATNSKDCVAKYRKDTKMATQQGAITQRRSRRDISRHMSLAVMTHRDRMTLTLHHRHRRHPAGSPRSEEQQHHRPHTAAKGTRAAPSSNNPRCNAPVTPGQALSKTTKSMESEAVVLMTLESSIAALETRLENKITTMMTALAAEITAAITNQFNVQVNTQVAEALPNMLAPAALEFSMCDISARMHCLAERRSKIGQTVTGKYANAMRVSNSIAAVTAPRPESSEETRASLLPRFPPCATEPSDESYVAPSGQ